MTTSVKHRAQKRCQFRSDVLLLVFEEFDIEVSVKNLPLKPPAKEVDIAGNRLLEEGWGAGCQEAIYEVIEQACDKKVGGKVQTQSVVEVLQRTHVGTKFENSQMQCMT